MRNQSRNLGVFHLITVGVPTSNRAWSLPSFLNALERLDYPKKRIRIVFSDNNSTDGTVQIIRQFVQTRGKDYEDVRLISVRSNIPMARNICVENSAGKFILFLDSDVIPPPDSVKRMMKVLEANPTAAIIGFLYRSRFVTRQGEGLVGLGTRNPYPELFIQAGCTMIRLSVFAKIGKFNTLFDFYEDWEFSARAFRAGYLTLVDPSKVVQHLNAVKSQATPKGIIMALLFVFKSISRGTVVARNGLNFEGSKHQTSSDDASLSRFSAVVLGTVFWKTFLTLVLMLFYSSSIAFQSWKGKKGSFVDAIYFLWLGLPLLVAIATFLVSMPFRSSLLANSSKLPTKVLSK